MFSLDLMVNLPRLMNYSFCSVSGCQNYNIDLKCHSKQHFGQGVHAAFSISHTVSVVRKVEECIVCEESSADGHKSRDNSHVTVGSSF